MSGFPARRPACPLWSQFMAAIVLAFLGLAGLAAAQNGAHSLCSAITRCDLCTTPVPARGVSPVADVETCMWDKAAHACVPATLPWDREGRSCEALCKAADPTLSFIPSPLFPTLQCEASLCPYVQHREVCAALYPHEAVPAAVLAAEPEDLPVAAAAAGVDPADVADALLLADAEDGDLGDPDAVETLAQIAREQRALDTVPDALLRTSVIQQRPLHISANGTQTTLLEAGASSTAGTQALMSLSSSARLALLQASSSQLLLRAAHAAHQVLTKLFAKTQVGDCARFAYDHEGTLQKPTSFEYQLSVARTCPGNIKGGKLSGCAQSHVFNEESGSCKGKVDKSRIVRASAKYVEAAGRRGKGGAIPLNRAYKCFNHLTDKSKPTAASACAAGAGIFALLQMLPKGTVISHVVERRGGATHEQPARNLGHVGDDEYRAFQTHHYVLIGVPGSSPQPQHAHPDTHIILDFWMGLAGGPEYLVHPVPAPQNTDPFFPASVRAHSNAAAAVHSGGAGSAGISAPLQREGPGHGDVGVVPAKPAAKPPSGVGALFGRRVVATHDVHSALIQQKGDGLVWTVVGGIPKKYPVPAWMRTPEKKDSDGKPGKGKGIDAIKYGASPNKKSPVTKALAWWERQEKLRKSVYALLHPLSTLAGRERARKEYIARVVAAENTRLADEKDRWTKQYAYVNKQLSDVAKSRSASLLEGSAVSGAMEDAALRARAEEAWAAHVEQRSVAVNNALARHAAATADRAQWADWARAPAMPSIPAASLVESGVTAKKADASVNIAFEAAAAAATAAKTSATAATTVTAAPAAVEPAPYKPLLSFVDMILEASTATPAAHSANSADAEAQRDADDVNLVLLELRALLSQAPLRPPLAALREKLSARGRTASAFAASDGPLAAARLSPRALAMLSRRASEAIKLRPDGSSFLSTDADSNADADASAEADADAENEGSAYELPPAQATAIARFLSSLTRPGTMTVDAAAAVTLPGETGLELNLNQLLSATEASEDYEALQLGLDAVLRAQQARAEAVNAPAYSSAVFAPDFEEDAAWGRLKYALWSDLELAPALSARHPGAAADAWEVPLSPYPHLGSLDDDALDDAAVSVPRALARVAFNSSALALVETGAAADADTKANAKVDAAERYAVYIDGTRFDLAPLLVPARAQEAASLPERMRLLAAIEATRAHAGILRPAALYSDRDWLAMPSPQELEAPPAVRAVYAKARAEKRALAEAAAIEHVLRAVDAADVPGVQRRIYGPGLRAALRLDGVRLAQHAADVRAELERVLPAAFARPAAVPAVSLVDLLSGTATEHSQSQAAQAELSADAAAEAETEAAMELAADAESLVLLQAEAETDAEAEAAVAGFAEMKAQARAAVTALKQRLRARVLAHREAGPMRESLRAAADTLRKNVQKGTLVSDTEAAARAWLHGVA